MNDRSDDATCLLGLDRLAVECVVLTVGGVRIVQLVTSDPNAARCPACWVVSTALRMRLVDRDRDKQAAADAWLDSHLMFTTK